MVAAGFALVEFLLLMAIGLGMKELGYSPSAVFKAGLKKLKGFFKRG